MSIKDLIYLTAIAMAALLAYCHGFFSGFGRARKIYDSLLGQPECPASGQGSPPAVSANLPQAAAAAPTWEFNGTRNRLSGQDLQGDFGNN